MIEAGQAVRQVYLDVCALNRPLDDQSQIRIRLEAEAVQLILSHVRAGSVVLVTSPAVSYEVRMNPDSVRRRHVELLLEEIGTLMPFSASQVRQRVGELSAAGIHPADAAHFAFAEQTGSHFITVDDRFLRQLQRIKTPVWFGTPVAYCEKEDLR